MCACSSLSVAECARAEAEDVLVSQATPSNLKRMEGVACEIRYVVHACCGSLDIYKDG